MNRKVIRTIMFQLHRWLGLVVGILLCIAGLTGSILVFEQEIDNFLLGRQMGFSSLNPRTIQKLFNHLIFQKATSARF